MEPIGTGYFVFLGKTENQLVQEEMEESYSISIITSIKSNCYDESCILFCKE